MRQVQSAIECSELDRERFGIAVAWARHMRREMVPHALEWCRKESVRLLIARCEGSDWPTVHALEKSGFLLMDTLVYYCLRVSGNIPKVDVQGVSFRQASLHDATAVKQAAARAFANYQGHYHNDPLLPAEKCDAIYSDWAYRSVVNNSVADTVLLALVQDQVAGFIALRQTDDHEADIPLNAVVPEFQRRGIYRALLAQALTWCQRHGLLRCCISTQLTNTAAQKAWVRLGFEPLHAVHTFHKWF
ncbi:MAG TPA: GNAT family N-acetyltransferase, partial [Verrucomicrobiota bacterium]|nr:GNAT family N-acetyltransferase [Verrucomicrobiota bacterium]